MKKLLKFLAIIVMIPVLILGLRIASCSVSDYLKNEEENQKPLVRAIKIWQNQQHSAYAEVPSSIIQKFISLGTSKSKAMNTLKENGFSIQFDTSKLLVGIYTRMGGVCRFDYEIQLKLNDNRVTQITSVINPTCL